jgi:HlyD family secretion protein
MKTKRLILTIVALTLTGLSAAMYARRGTAAPEIGTDVVSRGSIVRVVSASGTLEAVETVQVGTQVSGTVQTLNADYNSIVRKGQLLARLDPALIQADITRAEATLRGAEADRERLAVMVTDTDTKLQRAQALAGRQLIAATDLEGAEIAKQMAEAQLRAAEAQVKQARATLSQQQVNLAKTVITSPIDGIVISRSVDVGQTVAASLQAPTLFTIAADLSQMQVNANIDESDLGAIQNGMPVTFKVDAYPTDTFRGVVKQIRLNPVVQQNVVTYAAIVSAPNGEFKLKPGMTANLTMEVARRDEVLRVPVSALRFKPSAAVLARFGGGAKVSSRPDPGTVWVFDNDTLRAVPVQTGVTDGMFTEIVGGQVNEGERVATRATTPGATPTMSSGSNPLMGPTPPRR